VPTQHEKGVAFRRLHERTGAFVIPNPWDVGSARLLEALGFEALATTSAGFANTLGRLDGRVSLEEKLAHCRAVAAATTIPVSTDFENAFADAPAAVAENLVRLAETGVVGGSIEDFSRDRNAPIYDFALAVDRVAAAAEAVHALGFPFTLTARAENFLHGRRDLDDTLLRLRAYAAAGADVLFAPGLTTLEQIRRVTEAVDRPVNVLVPFVRDATLEDLAAAGVKRVSLGSALAHAAYGGVLRAGREMTERGTFSWLGEAAAGRDITRLLGPS
jgi:2-methylisocitrate lyase-like PEP mutase family enzyme